MIMKFNQSCIVKLIPATLVLIRLSIIWLARKTTHILTVVDLWRHLNHRQMPCRKNIANRQTFYSSFVRKKHCRALSKLSSTKHRPGQDKSLKLTRSQKVQLNYFISSFRDYINMKFEFFDLKELLYFMYFSAKRKNMFSQILRWPEEGRKHIVISLVHHGIVRK